MAQPTDEDQVLLLVSYSKQGDEWEEFARGDFEEELEGLLKDLPPDIEHYSLVKVYDGGIPLGEESAETYDY